MQVLCHYLTSFYEFEDKRQEDDASLLVVLLTNAISIFNNIIFMVNDEQSLAAAVSTKHRKFKIMLKSRCLHKSKSVDLGGAAPPFCVPNFYCITFTIKKGKLGNILNFRTALRYILKVNFATTL